jgi:hypothetical protein
MRIIFFILLAMTLLHAQIGVIGAIQGEAHLIRDGKNLEAKIAMVLQEKDHITTASRSKVQLMMQDESIITIGPDSEFILEQYSYDDSKQSRLDMRLKQGFFRTITGKIGKVAPQRFKLHTRSATIGIRGTDFGAFSDDEYERIGCFSGAIEVSATQGVYNLKSKMMIALHDRVWKIQELDISRFRSVLAEASSDVFTKTFEEHRQEEAYLGDLSQQEYLQESGLQIEPGYTLESPSPPPFVP